MAQSTATLRALTFRLNSAAPQELPAIAPQVAGALWSCKEVLSAPVDARATGEAATAVHRFKTQLNTLLQDRTVEGRWAAVVLTKAAIEAGGLEVLSKANPWVRHLLAILKRPDPATTRVFAVLTLTRIFTLTWDYANLVREITTPALAVFIPTCISNIENRRCSAKELATVLEAFALLIPRHPTIFRQNESKLRGILTSILSSTSARTSDSFYGDCHRAIAERLFVLLHHCAPKQGGSDKWQETLRAITESAHATCDHVFRAVQEDWQSVAGFERTRFSKGAFSSEPEVEQGDAAGMKAWKGIYAGSERIVALLRVLTAHLATSTSASIHIRLGSIMDLLTRLFAVVVPSYGKPEFTKFNNQIPKDEREALFSVLPQIHVAAIALATVLVKRLGTTVLAGCQIIVDQVQYVFQAEHSNTNIRSEVYSLLTLILEIAGPTMGKAETADLALVFRSCCADLLPNADQHRSNADANINAQGVGIKQQLGLAGGQISQIQSTEQDYLARRASDLLRGALLRINALPTQLRALIDRTAVLTRSHELLKASVMNPPAKKSTASSTPASLLPVFAREFGETAGADMFIRPRLPPVGRRSPQDAVDLEPGEEIEDEDNVMDRGDQEDYVQPAMIQDAREAQTEAPAVELVDALSHNASFESSSTLFMGAAAEKRKASDSIVEAEPKRLRASAERAQSAEASEPKSMIPQHSAAVPSSAPTVASYHTAVEGHSEDDSDFEIPEIHTGDTDDEE